MCRCKTVSTHSLALSSWMSKRFHSASHAAACRAASSPKPAAPCAAWRASSRLSEIARSREVYSAAIFSTVTGRSGSRLSVSACATKPGSATSRRTAAAGVPSMRILVRAATAIRIPDWLVSACSSTVSSPASAACSTAR